MELPRTVQSIDLPVADLSYDDMLITRLEVISLEVCKTVGPEIIRH
jgi:hypothetical protein